MRVLMLNRADADAVPGGDTVQMVQTMKGLVRLGVDVKLGNPEDIDHIQDYDVVHIFNWQQLAPILTKWPETQPLDRIVLSPIFWFHTGHWFDQAIQYKPFWQVMHTGLGKERSRRLYETWQQGKFTWGAEGRSLRRWMAIPKRILPNSCIELDHLENLLGLKGRLHSQSTIVPNGVSRELFDPLPKPDTTYIEKWGSGNFVVEIARIQAAKNQLGLIEALFDVNIPLVFIGQPSPYEADYVNRCYERGNQRGNVFFLGALPPEVIGGILVRTAVHALPSWRETPGLASLEAAAAGCRIVSTALGSPPEYFGDEAWYCDPHDPLSIRQAVLGALEAAPSSRLREKVLAQYTWDAAAKATLEGYRLAQLCHHSEEA